MVEVDLGKATVRELLQVAGMIENNNNDKDFQLYSFCDQVVVGGIMDVPLDETPVIIGAVAEAMQAHMQEIVKAIEVGKMLGQVEKPLDLEDTDDNG